MGKLTVELNAYTVAIQAMAKLSRLFTDSNTPFIHSRFAERIFVINTGARDLSRNDISFDAIIEGNRGVGVKTFRATNYNSSKLEKVAEFTREATLGTFNGLSTKELALKVADLRNRRVEADAKQYGVDIHNSIYHLIVRVDNGFFVVEEPYELISLSEIRPVGNRDEPSSKWHKSQVRFTDGVNVYSFNRAKNVLMKKFDLKNAQNKSQLFTVEILDDPFASIVEEELAYATLGTDDSSRQTPAIAQVVLPLYSNRGGIHIPDKSGINQWNAAGRQRNFGEAYIPIPSWIHTKFPDFFPDRDVQFKLNLPDGRSVTAKVCQSGRKALMSNPNHILMQWLYEIIDLSLEIASNRMATKKPYAYSDLLRIGKDSVVVRKLNSPDLEFAIELVPIGSYEEFKQELDSGIED